MKPLFRKAETEKLEGEADAKPGAFDEDNEYRETSLNLWED